MQRTASQKPGRSLTNRIGRSVRKEWLLHLMILPGVIGFFVFRYLPMYGVLISFEDYDIVKGVVGSQWIWFKNFTNFFQDVFFSRLLRNTFLLGFLNILWGFPIPIIFALMLNEVRSKRLKRVTQTVSYLPYFIPIVVLVGLMNEFFGYYGLVNEVIGKLGVPAQKFMSHKTWFRTMYVGSGVWQQMGYNSIVYLAALSAIDPGMYEAAVIDGASRWKRVTHITLPSLLPTITTLLLLNLSRVLNVGFEKVFLMYSPGSYETADVFSTYVYRRGLIGLDFGYGAAIDLFNAFVAFILVMVTNTIVKRSGNDGLY